MTTLSWLLYVMFFCRSHNTNFYTVHSEDDDNVFQLLDNGSKFQITYSIEADEIITR